MAERTIRWGILGAGRICNDFVRSFHDWAPNNQGNEIIAVGARSLENAKEFASKHKIGKAYGSYEELASDPEIDVIYVGTVHTYHLGVAKMCLDHGKHLLVEKPMTTSYKDSKELVDYARSKKLFLMEAIWSRFFPVSHLIRETIAAGTIGEPKYLSASLAFDLTHFRENVDDSDQGVDAFLGVYVLQAALDVFKGEPEEVLTSTVKNKHGVGEAVAYTLKFNGGGLAQLTASLEFNSCNKLIIEGTKGRIVVPENMWTPTEVYINDKKHEFPLPECDQSAYNFPRSVGLFYEVPPVADSIRKGLLESPGLTHQDMLTMAKIHDKLK